MEVEVDLHCSGGLLDVVADSRNGRVENASRVGWYREIDLLTFADTCHKGL
jgi:hypothetical protein